MTVPVSDKGISDEIAGGHFRNHHPARHPVGWLRSDRPAAARGAALAAEPALLSIHLDSVVVAGAACVLQQTPRALSEFLRTALVAVPDRGVGRGDDRGLCHGAMVGGT